MSSSYLSSIAKQILSRALFFGSVRAQKGQGAMRAAEGIFRTVNKPFGQVDARPSKSYRISWNGVCPLVRSQNDNSTRGLPIAANFRAQTSELDVKTGKRFHCMPASFALLKHSQDGAHEGRSRGSYVKRVLKKLHELMKGVNASKRR